MSRTKRNVSRPLLNPESIEMTAGTASDAPAAYFIKFEYPSPAETAVASPGVTGSASPSSPARLSALSKLVAITRRLTFVAVISRRNAGPLAKRGSTTL